MELEYDSKRELDGSGSEASIDHVRQNTERLALVNHIQRQFFDDRCLKEIGRAPCIEPK